MNSKIINIQDSLIIKSEVLYYDLYYTKFFYKIIVSLQDGQQKVFDYTTEEEVLKEFMRICIELGKECFIK